MTILEALHVLFLLGSGWVVAAYRPDGQTRYRAVVSIGAAAFAGSCFAWAMWSITQGPAACNAPQPWQAIFSGCIFIAVACTRGNVARLLPRLKWTTHT